MSRFIDHLLEGVHADRPVVDDVPQGTLYSCSTHGLVYQSDGEVWSTWAAVGSGGLEGEGTPTLSLDDGVNSIYVLGLLASPPVVGGLVLAVDDGENPPIEVTLSGSVVDDAVAEAGAVFAAQGVTVSLAPWSGGEFDGYPSFEFTGDYSNKAIAVSVVSNTIADGADNPIALVPADPVEVQAGNPPTPASPPDPTMGVHYLDTLTGLTWTYNGSSWIPPIGAVLDYVEVTLSVAFTANDDSAIIVGNPITLDGATPIVVEFYSCNSVAEEDAEGCHYILRLDDGGDHLFYMAVAHFATTAGSGDMPTYVRTPTLTLAAGEHTFSVKTVGGGGGGGTFAAGDGGADQDAPMYLRVTRA